MEQLIANAIVTGIICAVGGIAICIFEHQRKIPCNSCKYLAQKNCGAWKYRCESKNALFDTFDKPPTYCKYYAKKEEAKEVKTE